MPLSRFDGPTLTLVVNPSAGRGRAKRLLPKVATGLLTGLPGANLRVFQTHDFAEARLRTIAAVEGARPSVDGSRADVVLVMGGDGMAHLGLNACAGTDVPLGVLPAGTGNDFCASVGAATDPMDAVKAVVAGHSSRVDLMRVEGRLKAGATQRYVGCVLSSGYDGRVNRRTNRMKTAFLGPLAYGWAALAELAAFEPVRYRLTIDGHPRSQTAMLIAVANGGVFGGGMKISPEASVDDGLLNLTIVHPVSRATLLRLLPLLYTGGFVRDPAVERITAREVTIDGTGLYGMADGEELGDVPLSVTCEPKCLTVFVPPPGRGR